MCSPGRVAFSLSPNKALRGYLGPALRGSGHGRLGGRLLEGPPLAELAALVHSPDLPVYAVQPVLELVGGQHRDGADDGAAFVVLLWVFPPGLCAEEARRCLLRWLLG